MIAGIERRPLYEIDPEDLGSILCDSAMVCFRPRLVGQTLPQFQHVFIVLEENNNYDQVTTSSMPYLTGLMNSEGGVGGNYFAVTHRSIGNYMELTTGQIVTNDDTCNPDGSFSGGGPCPMPYPGDSIVRELLAARKTWKSYPDVYRRWW
jgi:hypothetical protein